MIWPSVGLVFTKFGKVNSYKIWNIQASHFSLVPYLKCFGISQLELPMVDLYYFKTIVILD